MQTNTKQRIQIISLLAVFIIPAVISWVMYHYHGYFQLGTTNHGVLLNPPIKAENLYSDSAARKWRIIQVSGEMCDAACIKTDYQLRQLQKALGKDRDRVQVVLMGPHYAPLQKLQSTIPGDKISKAQFAVNNKIYLVDPDDNVFMYYSSNANPMHILKDVKKVLEVSQIG